MRRVSLVGLAVLIAFGAAHAAEEVLGLPLHVERLNPKAVRVWLGDYLSSTATVALSTSNGIVVIDTVGIPKVDQELRQVIARELGRSDFKYLINTHEHADHTGGNSVYADCTIVAHQLCLEAMKRPLQHREEALRWHRESLEDLPRQIKKLPAASPEAKKLKEELVHQGLNLEALQANLPPKLPTRTFADQMTLDLGDTTLELYYAGSTHTASDIFIFIPQHGILMTGDTMADVWLTDTPGCLAGFRVNSGVPHDFPLLLQNWSLLLAKRDQIKDLIPGHWNGDISIKGFEDRYRYIKAMSEGIPQAVKEGKTLEDLFGDFRLSAKFPELVNSPGFNGQNQAVTILSLYSDATGLRSAAERLYELIEQGAPEDAIREVLAERDRKPGKYFFLEVEINGRGYVFLSQDRPREAVRLLKINADLFPISWNAYDSLAEAHMKNGDNVEAIKLYEKSLELNPDNKNGKEMLARLRAGAK